MIDFEVEKAQVQAPSAKMQFHRDLITVSDTVPLERSVGSIGRLDFDMK